MIRMYCLILFLLTAWVGVQTVHAARKPKKRSGKIAAKAAAQRDSEAQVVRFSGVSVSGDVRSLNLSYFMNRMRTEFERPRLPHRSFMPELQRSLKGKSF